MMNYLAELPFVDIFDTKNNNAFFWRVNNPLDYKRGVKSAKEFVEFIEKYPFMNNSNVLYRIACDMSESGLIKSESARGFFNTLDTLLTPKIAESSNVSATKSRQLRTVNNIANKLGITSLKLLNFLALTDWVDNATVEPKDGAIENGVLRKSTRSPFGFVITRKGENLLTKKYQLLNK
ncbi:hypothetical protein AW947_004403 [Salmonella enterica]|uniref:Uncharacterized protein n=1 Tax=Salmonella enterica TaxID=28901 RepID=A0A5Z4BY04_SALER|nr:hypothetical protein [Salmonella enterica]EEA2091579.1 hypothetical protein [Salmonella enterica subsp. enterica serovar Give]EBU2794482.1 hypothetical protein [Salmonella enterica]ECJ1089429.1 hypothetical protein [Salmonella enterica]ECO1854814.1 hypothetical protein [Salmonella enterica]